MRRCNLRITGSPSLVKLSVLYVDDDRDLRDVGELSLGLDDDIVVRTAESGALALALIDGGEWRPDVILLDVMMPMMDGPAVLTALRTRPTYERTPVIFITARTQAREVEAYRRLGIAGLITKPFDPLTLASEVRDIISRWAP